MKNLFSVFTKPWKTKSLDELGDLVAGIGFDAVEYPLRDGFQVQPSEGVEGIKKLARVLAGHNVKVASLAAEIDVRAEDGKGEITGINETVFAGCGEAGIPVIRICQKLNRNLDYHENIDALRRKYDKVLTLCQKYNVSDAAVYTQKKKRNKKDSTPERPTGSEETEQEQVPALVCDSDDVEEQSTPVPPEPNKFDKRDYRIYNILDMVRSDDSDKVKSIARALAREITGQMFDRQFGSKNHG